MVSVKNDTFAENIKRTDMAMAISSVPVLTGDVAEEFVRKAKQAEQERGTVDVSQMMQNMKAILERSKKYNGNSKR